MSKNHVVIIPVTLNGRQGAYAPVDPMTGFWGHRGGSTAFAFSMAKAIEISEKLTGFHPVPPNGFTGFGHPMGASAPVAAAPSPAKAPAAVEPKPRSAAQAAAWLKVVENNLARCLAGEIGGDPVKYAKSVETARASLEAALKREGK